ncbi:MULTISPECIES: hypothetical protein [Gordonia]|uniref:hypothetical protein n=1 Tax=Gordonia TaxID=2053 RepID=UPI00257C30DE|nr:MULTISPECIES: hypothetical protein [Gordonia]
MPVAAALPGGRYLQTLNPSNGVDDTAWLNTALAQGGYIRARADETYRLSNRLILPSSTAFDCRQCRFQAVDTGSGFATQLLVNKAAITVIASDEDAKCYAGSKVIDFYPGSNAATKFTVGQTVVIDGGGGTADAVVPLVATVTAVNADARNDGTAATPPNTITVDKAAKTTTNYWGIKAYTRDKDIRVIGGDWYRGAFAGGGIGGHSLMFRHVDNLDVQIEKFTSTNNTAHYGISVADISNYRLAIDNAQSGRDGIHIMGPAYSGEIVHVKGYTADDSVSLTAADYAGALTDSSGDIIGLTIGSINTQTVHSQLKIMPGVNNVIDGVKVTGVIQGSSSQSSPVFIGEDTGNKGTMGGTIGSVDVGTVLATPADTSKPQILLANPNARSIRARTKLAASAGCVCATGIGGTGSAGSPTPATIQRLILDVDATGPARLFNAGSSNTQISTLVLDGRYDQVSGASVALALGSKVDRVDARLDAALTAAFGSGWKRLGGQIGVDVSLLTPADGDLALNTNASLGCGVGPVVWNASAGKWKHLYTAATT